MKDCLSVDDNKSKKNILIVGGGFVGLTLAAKLLKNKENYATVLETNLEKVNNFHVKNYVQMDRKILVVTDLMLEAHVLYGKVVMII
jgi:NADH dehydrogenase FAD-containing subunit